MPRTLTEEQKESKREYMKQYREQNKDKIKERKKEYRDKNKDKIKERKKEYRDKNKDKIKQHKKEYQQTTGAIVCKISHTKEADIKKNREFNIDVDYIKELLENQQYNCANCNIKVKMEWTDKFDKEQFSINRIDNKIGHIKGNVEITCWGCNHKLGREDWFKRGSIYRHIRKKNNKEWYSWVFSYHIDGKIISKYFSVTKHRGEENAYKMCIDLQNEIYPL